MVLDTSAVTAILRNEPERDRLLQALLADPRRLVSPVTYLEATLVIEGRYGAGAGADLELLLHTAGIEVVPFTSPHAEMARRAWRRYGKGNHPAALNLGDCCVYALAEATGEPILCKGDDFPRTDIALVPY